MEKNYVATRLHNISLYIHSTKKLIKTSLRTFQFSDSSPRPSSSWTWHSFMAFIPAINTWIVCVPNQLFRNKSAIVHTIYVEFTFIFVKTRSVIKMLTRDNDMELINSLNLSNTAFQRNYLQNTFYCIFRRVRVFDHPEWRWFSFPPR